MPEPNGVKEGGGFLMKKFGPLPIAAYVVAGAALIGFMVFRNKGTKTTGASTIQAAPTGIQDPTTDQNAALYATLNDIETALHGSGSTAVGTVGNTTPQGADMFQTWALTNWSGTSPQGRPASGFDRWVSDVLGQFKTSTGQSAAGTTQTPSGSFTTTDQSTYNWLSQQWATTHPSTPPTKPGPIGPWQAMGGGEAPERILPDYMLRPPVHLNTEMSRRPAVLTQPR